MNDVGRYEAAHQAARPVRDGARDADRGAARVHAHTRIEAPDDHFVERDGLKFAGTHLILDLWNASRLDDLAHVECTLRQACTVAGATLLKIDLHSFAPTDGITGVAILAESHISIHTWPERSYAAIDLFMCGQAKPHKAIEVIRKAFSSDVITLVEHKRGVLP